jgi:hypothetical protein
MRTDDNNNPTAFTTDVAIEAHLIQGHDFVFGTPFEENGHTYYTAKLIGNPIALTIAVIDRLGFFTGDGVGPRWSYITMEHGLWVRLSFSQQRAIIGVMYTMEGGTAMRGLFAE